MMRRTMAVWFSTCVAFSLLAAVPEDGGEWMIESGTAENLNAAATVSRLLNDGGLTLGEGAALAINGTGVSAIATDTGRMADLTIGNGASLVATGTLDATNPGNTQGFSIGTYGGTGTVSVASGGSLTVANGRFFLGRNSLTDADGADRNRFSHGILTLSGTVTAPFTECGAWYPSLDTSLYGTYRVDELPVAAVVNLEEGGVFETGHIQLDDVTLTIFNFRGGILRAQRQNDNFVASGGAILWAIEAGKNLIFDTQSYNIRIQPPKVQPDFIRITGAGGLVKRGSGYLHFCNETAQNTFTGPITVEEGALTIGRPLAEGQTVFVKKGAQFYPSAPGDLAKITYEDSAEAPQEGSIYRVEARLYDGLDLLAMAPTYRTDALGGPSWGWSGRVYGTITHADGIDLDHPFSLVSNGTALYFYGTGIESLPLTIDGTGTFFFDGARTVTADNAITFTGPATYQQADVFAVMGGAGEMPTMTVSGGGTLKTGQLRVGYDGADGALVVKDGATVAVEGDLRIGANIDGNNRKRVKGRLVVENGTVSTTGDINFAPNGLTDGSDRTTVLNELVLGPGADLRVGSRLTRNDDAHSRIAFQGGKISPLRNYAEFFYSGQEGILDVEAVGGHDVRIEVGTNSVGMISNHTHLFGEGGLSVVGKPGDPFGIFTLGAVGLSDFTVAYTGDTTITDATLRLGVPLPGGGVIAGSNATLDLNHFTLTNTVTGDLFLTGYGTLVVGADGGDLTFDKRVGQAGLAKIGGGTLTLGAPFGGALTVKEGSAVIQGNAAAYRSYRFKVEGIKGPEGGAVNSMQLAELMLLDGSRDVTRPYAEILFDTAVEAGGTTYPENEAPGNLVDGSVLTKWLDFRALPSRLEADRDRVWLQINYAEPKTITGYAWYTANDTPGRDPAAWRLQGSNDGGVTWTDLDVRTGFTATDTRRCLAGEFPVLCPLEPTSVMTVEPGATLRVDGGKVPVSAIDNYGTVELVNGATLVSEGGFMRGDLTGDGSVEVTGGRVTLAGTPSYSGDTHVSGGTLDVGAPAEDATRGFDGKYFRLTIKRVNGGSGADGGDNVLQASEFQLYNAAGVMQNLGLTAAEVGLPAFHLAPGTFTTPRAYTYTGTPAHTDADLFDGNTATKLCCNDNVDGTPEHYHIVTMRLADDAEPITGYNFFTANDSVRRSPSDWTLEGSRDGISWELLDERYWAPHTAFGNRNDNSADGVKYKPFNNGLGFAFETPFPPAFTGKFLRFTFKKTSGKTMLQISELMVFDTFGGNVAYGLVKGPDGVDATVLAPGSFSKGANYSSGNNQDADKLFDGKVSTKLCANNNDMKGEKANYRIFILRLRDEALPLTGYLFTTANDNLGRSPCDWTVEGSVDGEHWTVLDDRAGVPQPFCLFTAMNAGHPFPFTGLASDGGAIPVGSTLQVDAGAVVNLNDPSSTVSALRVDCARGGGTINTFRPAANGLLELVNLPDGLASLVGFEIPLTVTNLQNGDTLAGWTVTVDGVDRGLRVKAVEDHLVLMEGGTVLIIN
ncbi:MAG: hypothetical protein J6334_08465 [Kiritimatiellae bacterium]|nr:hypothetical protein [Kiritimatiellia bacterium]